MILMRLPWGIGYCTQMALVGILNGEASKDRMRFISELNILDCGYDFPKVPPTHADIEEFQTLICATLPESYLHLLNFANGGNPGKRLIVPDDCDKEPYLIVDIFFALSSDKTYSYSLWEYYRIVKEEMPNCTFPFGCDGGGDLFFLSLAGGDTSVWYGNSDNQFRPTVCVAKSFEKFLERLRPFTDLPDVCDMFERGPNGRPRVKNEFLP